MNIRDLIRISVLKTNSVWPFIYLNKLPYHFAVKTFIYFFSSFKEIKSIYLRHGMTKKNWVPAISDIDLTIIIDGNLLPEETYDFLKSFWEKFERLKKIFPVLGEVDILDESEIESWTRFTIRGYEARNWKLLYGEKTVKSNYKSDQNMISVDSLNYAITNYLEYFIPKFYSKGNPDIIVSAELSRLASKIVKYAASSFSNNNKRKNKTGLDRRAELLYSVMKGLEPSVRNIKISAFSEEKNFKQDTLLTDVNTEEFKSEYQEIDLSKLESCRDKIDAFIISYTTRFIILKDGIKDDEIIDCIETIQKVFSKQNIKPIILNFAIFEYYLKIYNPFIYSQLLDGRKILFGEDLFLKVKQPDYYFYCKSLIEETSNILLFSRNRELIQSNSVRHFIQNGFSSKAIRGLFLKLYLEKSILEPKYNRHMDDCKKFYPQYIQQVNDLINNNNLVSEDQLSFNTYNLLKSFASDIHKSLISSGISEN